MNRPSKRSKRSFDRLSIVFDPGNEAAAKFVNNGVDNHNIAATGHAEYYPVALFLKSDENEIVGGLLGDIWGGWLHVRVVWVALPARGNGCATRLLEAAETYARKKLCRGAFLETFSFQARPFYEKLGYEVFSTLDDYPPGHRRFFMKKALGSPTG